MSKRALGRGIDALLAGNEGREAGAGSGVSLVPVSALRAGAHQPRKHFPEETLAELARSIQEKGVLQPILVEEADGGGYRIVAGERRFRAAQLAGLKEIPVLVRRFSETEKTEIALIENLQREDLSPIEEATGYKTLMQQAELTQEEVAKRVGKNRSTVANSLRLLKLPKPMIEALDKGGMSSGHARAILSLVNPADQELLFQRILAREMSVREAEQTAARLSRGIREAGKKSPSAKPGPRSPELAALEQSLIERLGTKVLIRGSEKRGKIEISYFSLDDLERISALIKSPKQESKGASR
jgi:ParB family chromosome partitioning protein